MSDGVQLHRRRDSCRACGAGGLELFLDLGSQPLANAFLHSPAEFAGEPAFPLALYLCHDCGLVQLADVIAPEALFRNYIYVTGTSETMAAHNRAYAGTVAQWLGLGPGDLVVEAASNDGSLLACFQQQGSRVLGVEPALNLAELARGRGIPTEAVFFGPETAARLRAAHGPARAVLGNNVLAHVDDPRGFLAGARSLLADDGLVIVEVPYLGELLRRLEYDTVYHEHLSYFSISALLRLAGDAELRVVRIDQVPVHGGSLRLYAAPAIAGRDHAADVLAAAAAEREAGLTAPARWHRFAADVERHRTALRELLTRLQGEGRTLAAYGAPAKGNTLLNYCGIGVELLPYTVDRNPLKVGCFTPGMHLPVLPVESLPERRPDVLVVLAWNFAEEIMRQQRAHTERGGRFLLPLPVPQLLD
ncbi:MAG TPA: class I SAM-dependent methyltransferase [Gemmatimonadales bacterium]|nr:class I SAM-dependent methyltransferase [Gemmatimonadales bacterium]